MIDVHSVEFYAIAFAVAFGLFGLIVGRRDREPGATVMAALTPCLTDVDAHGNMSAVVSVTSAAPEQAAGSVNLKALPGGNILLTRTGVPLRPNDSAYVVATLIDDRLNIVEKTSESQRSNLIALPVNCQALLNGLPQRRFYVRYDSEITGQWATFAITNTDGREADAELRY